MASSSQDSLELIYKVAIDRFVFLHKSAEEIDRKAAIYLAAIGAIISAVFSAIPKDAHVEWAPLFGACIVILAVVAPMSLYLCIRTLASRKFPAGPNVGVLIDEYVNKPESETISQLLVTVNKQCTELDAVIADKSQYLRRLNRCWLHVLVILLIFVIATRSLYTLYENRQEDHIEERVMPTTSDSDSAASNMPTTQTDVPVVDSSGTSVPQSVPSAKPVSIPAPDSRLDTHVEKESTHRHTKDVDNRK